MCKLKRVDRVRVVNLVKRLELHVISVFVSTVMKTRPVFFCLLTLFVHAKRIPSIRQGVILINVVNNIVFSYATFLHTAGLTYI